MTENKFSRPQFAWPGLQVVSNSYKNKNWVASFGFIRDTASLFVLVGLFSLIVYLQTLAPTITWQHSGADSGDFASAVAVGGVPHPPGYPTYIALGTIFQYIPFGDVAYRLNLLSAFSAALTVALTSLITYRILLSRIDQGTNRYKSPLIWCCAFSAGLLLAFAPLFWSQAIIAEVYALNSLFVALLLYGVVCISPVNERWLISLLSFGLALGLGNHFSLLLVLPGLVIMMEVRWRLALIPMMVLPFLAGLLIYATIYWRATTLPPVNWGLATSWPNFIWLVTAEAYRHFLFAAPLEVIPPRLVSFAQIVSQAFMGWGIPVGLVGLLFMVRRSRRLFFGLAITFFIISVYAVTYDTTDSYVYLLPVLLIFSICIGLGLFEMSYSYISGAQDNLLGSRIIWGVIILLPLVSLLANFSTQDLSEDYEAYTFARESLEIVQPQAIILTNDDARTFALWYVRYGYSYRPDVAIVNSNLLPYPWYRTVLQQNHPHLTLSNPHGRPLNSLSPFVEANYLTTPVYFATHSQLTPDEFQLESVGDLQFVVSPNNK